VLGLTPEIRAGGYSFWEACVYRFDNAIRQRVAEIYETLFGRTVEQQRLIRLLEDFGFVKHGAKTSVYGVEQVYVRDFRPAFNATDPKLTFHTSADPRVRLSSDLAGLSHHFATRFHTTDRVATEFCRQRSRTNAIRKVYVSRSVFRALRRGDVVVFDRTAPKGKNGYHHSVATTIGIVEGIYKNIASEEQFIRLCRKRRATRSMEFQAAQQTLHCRLPVRLLFSKTPSTQGPNRQ
jgi:hypothetical protein